MAFWCISVPSNFIEENDTLIKYTYIIILFMEEIRRSPRGQPMKESTYHIDVPIFVSHALFGGWFLLVLQAVTMW